jgi:xanthine/uracil permease
MRRLLVEIHEAADEAQKKPESLSYRLGKWLLGVPTWITLQIHRFRHSLSLFVMAAILILAMTTGEMSNLIPVIVFLVVFGVVWMAITSFDFEADKESLVSSETAEIEDGEE